MPIMHMPCVSIIAARKLPEWADAEVHKEDIGPHSLWHPGWQNWRHEQEQHIFSLMFVKWEARSLLYSGNSEPSFPGSWKTFSVFFFFSPGKRAHNLPTHLTQNKSIAWMSFVSDLLSSCKGPRHFLLSCTSFIELWQIFQRQIGKDSLSTAESS